MKILNAPFGARELWTQLVLRVWLMLVLSAYPVFYMRQALFRDGSRIGFGPSDMNYSIADLQSLRLMPTPWARTTRFGFPEGVEFWEPLRIVHAIPNLVGWFLVRFVSPVTALNILLLVGWVLTGLATYWVSRLVGLDRLSAVVAGVLVELLPWFPIKLSNHIFYVFYFVPITLVGVVLLRKSIKVLWWISMLIVGLTAAFFTDSYLFVISLLAVFSAIVGEIYVDGSFRKLTKQTLQLSRRTQVLASMLTVALIFLGVNVASAFLSLFDQSNRQYGVQPRGIVGIADLSKWSGTIYDLFTPSDGHWLVRGVARQVGESDFVSYGGAFPALLALLLAIPLAKRKISRKIYVLIFPLFLSIVAALRPVEIAGTPVSLNVILRYIFPQIRVFARFAVVGQILIIVLAIYSASWISNRGRSNLLKRCIFAALVVGIAIDLSPAFRPPVYSNQSYYSAITEALSQSQDAQGLLIPDGKLEAIDLSIETAPDSVDWEMINDYKGQWRPPVFLRAAFGNDELSSYLLSIGVNRVVARSDAQDRAVIRGVLQDSVRVNLVLDSEFFKPIVSQIGMDGHEVTLLEVVNPEPRQRCRKCALAQLLFSPQLDALGASAGELIDRTLWSQGEILEFHSELIGDSEAKGTTFARIQVVTLDPSINVVLETADGRLIGPQIESENQKVFEFETETNSAHQFRASGPCTVTSAESGPYCWGIGQFVVVELQGG